MNKPAKVVVVIVLGLVAVGVTVATAIMFGHGARVAVLQPNGPVARQELALILVATLLMLLIVVPVFILTAMIAWKYRATNRAATYTPDWDHHRGLEFLWWALPCLIIGILAIITWASSHALDPYRPLTSNAQPLTIQVVALDWKWLFIYPEQHIASVNLVEFPQKTPINFEVTSDAPMNSFWIPELAGQIYAMPGMSTELHLLADSPGDYQGSSANISGVGFAGMKFVARTTTQANFDHWVAAAQHAPNALTLPAYNTLAQPSQNNPVATYTVGDNLYNDIVMKYMMPMPAQGGAL